MLPIILSPSSCPDHTMSLHHTTFTPTTTPSLLGTVDAGQNIRVGTHILSTTTTHHYPIPTCPLFIHQAPIFSSTTQAIPIQLYPHSALFQTPFNIADLHGTKIFCFSTHPILSQHILSTHPIHHTSNSTHA